MRMIAPRGGFPAVARARRWMVMPRSEQRLFIVAGVVVALVRVTLWLLPSRVILGFVRRIAEPGAGRPLVARPAAARITHAIEAVSQYVPQATCLTQAVAAQLLLQHHGYQSRLCLGATRSALGAFAAHAWIEHDGCIVVGGAQSTGFTILRAPTASPRPKPGIGGR